MSILIKGMEMPTTCAECRLSTAYNFKERPLCDALVEYISYGEWQAKRLDNCPLVLVPEHGDLIDRDKLERDIERYVGGEESRSRFHHWVQVQQVVIPKGETKT